ncbi:transposase [Bordetella bronchiseptica]|uniref:transposase n=1 Tax=Bordetella bronchiseptica TaxID=518 RepID=UPI00067E350B|nr:transposase [Bordetella bronchiseptica]
MSNGIEPLCQFAHRLRTYLPGILAHTRWPLGTNLVEGIKNRIKTIKPRTYGLRDDHYVFLKIRALPRKSAMNLFFFPIRSVLGSARLSGL